MATVRNILLIILALLVQTSWVSHAAIGGVTPDTVLLVLVYIGLSGGQIAATLIGFVSGFLLDVYNPQAMGINTLANSAVGFGVGYSRVGVVAEDLRAQALVLLAAAVLHDLIYFVLYSISSPALILPLFLRYGLGAALYTTGLGVCISLLLSLRFDRGVYLDVRRLFG